MAVIVDIKQTYRWLSKEGRHLPAALAYSLEHTPGMAKHLAERESRNQKRPSHMRAFYRTVAQVIASNQDDYTLLEGYVNG